MTGGTWFRARHTKRDARHPALLYKAFSGPVWSSPHSLFSTPFQTGLPALVLAMNTLDISTLTLHDPRPRPPPAPPPISDDIMHATDDRYMVKLRNYAKSIPYAIEPNSRMQEMLDFILLRLTQCVEAKDYDPGLLQWDSMLT